MFIYRLSFLCTNIFNSKVTSEIVHLFDIARSVMPAAPIAPIANTPVQNDFGGLCPLK
jgi:hypothetical protein